MGSSSGGGLDNLLSSHSKANLLTRLTAILAACFMISSLGLAILANRGSSSDPIVEETDPVSPENAKEVSEPPVPLAQLIDHVNVYYKKSPKIKRKKTVVDSTRFIFVTGGVASSLGKGLLSASLGALIQACGLTVRLRKLDPYLNVDPGD